MGTFLTSETKRAAIMEWPPRSVKKSASKSITGSPSASFAAASRCASVTELGASCTPAGASTTTGSLASSLRSTLPEASRGNSACVRQTDGTM